MQTDLLGTEILWAGVLAKVRAVYVEPCEPGYRPTVSLLVEMPNGMLKRLDTDNVEVPG